MDINGVPLSALTPLGALCLVLAFPYLQIARGKLVPKSTLDAMERDHVREVEILSHDRDEWRTEGRVKDQHIAELTDQNSIMLREIAPTMNSFLASLRTAAAEARLKDGSP